MCVCSDSLTNHRYQSASWKEGILKCGKHTAYSIPNKTFGEKGYIRWWIKWLKLSTSSRVSRDIGAMAAEDWKDRSSAFTVHLFFFFLLIYIVG
jgi:hypothetical protein